MKRTKKIALIMLAVALMAVCFVFGASALEPTGQCGDNVYWDFDSENGELVISGNGPMYDYQYSEGSSPFYDESDIKKVVIEENVTTVGDFAFTYCKEISDLTLGNSIVCIGDHSFAFCDALINVDIPDSVTTIKQLAFYNSKNLSSVKIGKEVAVIEWFVFDFCYKLAEFSVHKDNANYSTDENGVLFNKDKTVLIKFPEGSSLEHYKIPDGVTAIGDYAFLLCKKLTNISVPSNVTTIGAYSFCLCFNLDNIILPDSITCFGEGAFAFCSYMTKIVVPYNVKVIGPEAVCIMPFLEEITVESLDVEIGEYFCYSMYDAINISRKEFAELFIQHNLELIYNPEYEKHIIELDEPKPFGTIYCHSGSTAETYAIENGIDYELTHFFKGDWTYDYDNMIRTRKCIHCDELETEPLETTGNGDVEIIEPVDPDTDFDVDEIKGDKFIVVEETVVNGIEGNAEVLRAFDITLKNKDGVHVQPDGTVKVKLPLDWTKDGVYKVYRVNDDGTLTDMNAYRQGSHMVFETDHFSIYVIVDVSEKSEADEPETPDTPDVPAEPDTSDCNCICHKEGIFFEMLTIVFRFVTKLLGVFPTCDCGIAHY